MELNDILRFQGKTELLLKYLKEYMLYKIPKHRNKYLINQIKKILGIILDVDEVNIFLKCLPEIKQKVNQDALFAYQNDPSFHSLEETIITSPGINSIIAYRVSNCLFKNKIKIIPRLISEFSHSKTGVDINPEADIGCPFFIDHGTGIVIGATCKIGNNVKVYHGVTLGAKTINQTIRGNTEKRHPTIEDDVTIYCNATILGGKTVISKGKEINTNEIILNSI